MKFQLQEFHFFIGSHLGYWNSIRFQLIKWTPLFYVMDPRVNPPLSVRNGCHIPVYPCSRLLFWWVNPTFFRYGISHESAVLLLQPSKKPICLMVKFLAYLSFSWRLPLRAVSRCSSAHCANPQEPPDRRTAASEARFSTDNPPLPLLNNP